LDHPAATSGDALADAYSRYVASCKARGVLPCSRESFEADSLQQLKALALAATPGPWHAPGMGEIHAENHDDIAQITFHTGDDEDCQCGTEADAKFIAGANPAVVLDMIARIGTLQGALKMANERLADLTRITLPKTGVKVAEITAVQRDLARHAAGGNVEVAATCVQAQAGIEGLLSGLDAGQLA